MILPRSWDGLEHRVAAALRRAAGRITLHHIQFRLARIRRAAVGELAGQPAQIGGALATHQLSRLARGDPGLRRRHRLVDHHLGVRGVGLEPVGELFVADLLHERLHFGVAQLGLGLTLELRFADLDRDHRGQAFANVVAGEVRVLVFQQLLVFGVLVHHRRQRAAEALFVGAALVGVDGVGEGVHGFRVAAVPLHRDLDLVAGTFAVEVDDALLDRALGAVDVLDEVDQTAGVVEGAVLNLMWRSRFRRLFLGRLGCVGGIADDLVDDLLVAHPLVGEVDGQPLVEERHFLQPARHRLEVVLGGLEDVGVGPEPDRGARPLGGLTLFERSGYGVVVELRPFVAIAGDVHLEPGRQRVDHRDAHAVQATADVVTAVLTAELAAGVKLGHDDVDGGGAGRVHRDRDAAPVVGDLDAAVVGIRTSTLLA